jgi:hypothetical protein
LPTLGFCDVTWSENETSGGRAKKKKKSKKIKKKKNFIVGTCNA